MTIARLPIAYAALMAFVTIASAHGEDDPLADLFRPHVTSAVASALDRMKTETKYSDSVFPLDSAAFESFRSELVDALEQSLGLSGWRVHRPLGKMSRLASRYRDHIVEKLTIDGLRRELHVVDIPDAGLSVPMVVTLPPGDDVVAGVCVFSGHTQHGLYELVVDRNSYQAGLASRLATAGFATIAVEKIDAGYLSRDTVRGVDEPELAGVQLYWGQPLRAQQLMACLASAEILASHPRVDASRIGAAGVSLGGWLSLQTALLSDRIVAVADFGVKTLMVRRDVTAADFVGIRDMCHILPGMLALGDRNVISLAYCPRPLLAGHGRADAGSARDAGRHFQQLLTEQYRALDAVERFRYLEHEGGDVMPAEPTVAFFREQLNVRRVAIANLQGEMVGEVSAHGAILQSRLTAPIIDDQGDLPGRAGVARFEIAENPHFDNARFTDWHTSEPESDYIVKEVLDGLRPGTKHYYRLHYGLDFDTTYTGPTRSFRTHLAPDERGRHSFVVVTGMNYAFFHNGGPGGRLAYQGPDKQLGYPALAAIDRLQPDFFIGTGDNVYYDSPRIPSATTIPTMRKKWHEQLMQPRFVELFGRVPTYWEKDDHDFRYDDADRTTDQKPTVDEGIRIFREQLPVVNPRNHDAKTYRTYRAGQLLQIWLVENRDYRSPNAQPDSPRKTLWGAEQREWLKATLLESDATFKLLISPTPMVGPDDRRKIDNHADLEGFRSERDQFFAWANEHQLMGSSLYFVCGRSPLAVPCNRPIRRGRILLRGIRRRECQNRT